jgi:hypothetical protein
MELMDRHEIKGMLLIVIAWEYMILGAIWEGIIIQNTR